MKIQKTQHRAATTQQTIPCAETPTAELVSNWMRNSSVNGPWRRGCCRMAPECGNGSGGGHLGQPITVRGWLNVPEHPAFPPCGTDPMPSAPKGWPGPLFNLLWPCGGTHPHTYSPCRAAIASLFFVSFFFSHSPHSTSKSQPRVSVQALLCFEKRGNHNTMSKSPSPPPPTGVTTAVEGDVQIDVDEVCFLSLPRSRLPSPHWTHLG